jgi:hypothetical protein
LDKAKGKGGDRLKTTGRSKKSKLLLLPTELLKQVLDNVPSLEQLRLAHVCRTFRATLCPGGAPDEEFWVAVCQAHWGGTVASDSGARAAHCRQCAVVLENVQMLCSKALRVALNVHYTCSASPGGGGPLLQCCSSNSGSPAIYNTRTPLGLCLLLNPAGKVLGFAIFVTVRSYVVRDDPPALYPHHRCDCMQSLYQMH